MAGERAALAAEAFSRIWCKRERLYSANSLKRPQRDWSAGIGLFFRQVPQAYSKKSWQGSICLSMASRSNDLGGAAFFSGLEEGPLVCAAAVPIKRITIKEMRITGQHLRK